MPNNSVQIPKSKVDPGVAEIISNLLPMVIKSKLEANKAELKGHLAKLDEYFRHDGLQPELASVMEARKGFSKRYLNAAILAEDAIANPALKDDPSYRRRLTEAVAWMLEARRTFGEKITPLYFDRDGFIEAVDKETGRRLDKETVMTLSVRYLGEDKPFRFVSAGEGREIPSTEREPYLQGDRWTFTEWAPSGEGDLKLQNCLKYGGVDISWAAKKWVSS